LTGHNHFVSDLSLSQDNNFLISSSWDKTLRLWDLRTGLTIKRFVGHTKEVFTCCFSPDNRQIVSSGADKTIKLWNTLADCKFTSESNNHTEWVSCVRYSPMIKTQSKVTFEPYFASVGWDGRLKIWNINFQIRSTFKPHDGSVNTVAISPNSKYLATGGRDKSLHIWDVSDLREPIRTIEAGSVINQIQFNPKLQWVSAATDSGVKGWDLGSDSEKPILDLTVDPIRK
jgi:guanine nucleotide-binding protein subunit beta-2-like 1 protein